MTARIDKKTTRIGVLMGGTSAEREVSLRTGNAVLASLNQAGFTAIAIDAADDLPRNLVEQEIDVAFIALHGRPGEDGTVQGLLEVMEIPYTGSGVLASSLAMDKVMTKRLLLQAGIPTPDFKVYAVGEKVETFVDHVATYPCIAKPSREGSTIGVSIATDAQGLQQALMEGIQFDRRVLVEPFFKGRELTVSVVNGVALPIIEIIAKTGFYDYEAKYTKGQTDYVLPAPLPEGVTAAMQQAAVKACALLECRGAARVDFLANDNEWTCLEVNTIPGMTETSLLPKAAAHTGMSFEALCVALLDDAGLDK